MDGLAGHQRDVRNDMFPCRKDGDNIGYQKGYGSAARVRLRQLYLRIQLNEVKKGSHRRLSSASWPEEEASSHPVHSSCLSTTSNHRHHYQQPDPLITSHPSTKGSWGSHALTATGAQGQWKHLGCNRVFWHAREISHCTSELQNKLRGDKRGHFHEGGTRPSKPTRPSSKSRTKGTGTE